MSVLQATTAPPAAAGAEHHAAATCASFGTPAEHAQTGALNLTLPIPYGRHATTERRFSPTRFIRRHAAVVPALGLASAADKRYLLGITGEVFVFWWEKHVEYKFIKEADYDFAIPLSGQAEAALSDLIFGSRDKLVLIEFKRDRAALSSEAKKFTKSLDDVETALEDHPKCHYFVYAVVADNCFSLEGCGYFNREAISPRDILKRGVGLEEFKSYCKSLMSHRAPDERCSSVFSLSGDDASPRTR